MKNKNYINITKEVLNNLPNRKGKVIDLNYIINIDGNIYYVDNKNIILDYSKEEYECAKWLAYTFNEDVYMVPRVNKPDGIQTPDFIFKNERYDLKIITGRSKRIIDNIIKLKQKQTHNFIIDVTFCMLKNSELIEQITKIYDSKGRKWVNIFIIKKHENIVIITKRKRD